MQPQVGSIAHVHPRHYADFSQLHKHMVAADKKLKRNQTAKNVGRWECCTILPVSPVEHLLMYWPHSLLQLPGLMLHSLHSNWKPKSKLPWADMIEEQMTPSLARSDFSSRTGTWTMKTAMQTNKRTLEWYYWFEKKNLHGYNYRPHIQLLFLGDEFPIFCPNACLPVKCKIEMDIRVCTLQPEAGHILSWLLRCECKLSWMHILQRMQLLSMCWCQLQY